MQWLADMINERTGLTLEAADVRIFAELAVVFTVAAAMDRWLGTSIIRVPE